MLAPSIRDIQITEFVALHYQYLCVCVQLFCNFFFLCEYSLHSDEGRPVPASSVRDI